MAESKMAPLCICHLQFNPNVDFAQLFRKSEVVFFFGLHKVPALPE